MVFDIVRRKRWVRQSLTLGRSPSSERDISTDDKMCYLTIKRNQGGFTVLLTI